MSKYCFVKATGYVFLNWSKEGMVWIVSYGSPEGSVKYKGYTIQPGYNINIKANLETRILA